MKNIQIFLSIIFLIILNVIHQIYTKDDTSKNCNPEPNPSLPQYMIAYGSLMQEASKSRTFAPSGPNYPIHLQNYRRSWNLRGGRPGYDTTYLGVLPYEKSHVYASVFQLPSNTIIESLKAFDIRETYYCRHQVNRKDIRWLGNTNHEGSKVGQYWIYINKPEFTYNPTKVFPIVQSYVDIFLSGCIEMEENYSVTGFARRCIESTSGWTNKFWVNDRLHPRRPFIHQPMSYKVDKLLDETIPLSFVNIRIEG